MASSLACPRRGGYSGIGYRDVSIVFWLFIRTTYGLHRSQPEFREGRVAGDGYRLSIEYKHQYAGSHKKVETHRLQGSPCVN